MQQNLPVSVLSDLEIEKLTPWPRHARKHDRGKSGRLAKILISTGYLDPIVVDDKNTILSGHLRVEVYKSLGYDTIPGLVVSHLSTSQKRAFVIGANRFPERGKWDTELLRLEFSELVLDSEIDLGSTGFELAEIDLTLGHNEEVDPEEPVTGLPEEVVSRSGDLWKLGEHFILCADCRDGESWDRLMAGQKAQACVADPPYNVRIQGNVSSKKHKEFLMASGEMSPEEFTRFLEQSLELAAKHSLPGALHYVFMDSKHLEELLEASSKVYSERLALIVWAKTNAGMGSLYRSQHELIVVSKVGKAPNINNVQLGRMGRYRTNVWNYPGCNTFRQGRDQDLADHPTIKPVEMIADILLDVTNIGDVVIDGFGGSGTLLVAAEKTARKARVIEIDPRYVDVSIKRWEAFTGKTAILTSTGDTFDKVSDLRNLKLLPPPVGEDPK